MINSARAVGIGLEWSAAEILDMPFSDDLLLRALVCEMDGGMWQWSVSSLDGAQGELISAGEEKSAAAARRMATSEIAKCLEGPLD
jgi:hypothetical protein